MKHDSFHVGIDDPEVQCIVCGKRVSRGQETARLQRDGVFVVLCCPLCMEAYEEKPAFFEALRAGRMATQKRTPSEPKGDSQP